MAKTSSKKKERGKLLIALIALGWLSVILLVLRIYITISSMMYSWEPFMNIVELLICAVALFSIWRWKKWGLYLLFFLVALNIVMIPLNIDLTFSKLAMFDFILFEPHVRTLMVIDYFGEVVAIVVWFWAIRRKWKYFE